MRYIGFKTVQEKLDNRSRSSIYRDIEAGRLPPGFKIGARRYWNEHELDDAITALAE